MTREHRYLGTEGFTFDITGELPSYRMYQRWKPAGLVVWDGERAWSTDWDRHDRLKPRFVTSIGFFLINLPWLLPTPEVTRVLTETVSLPEVGDQPLLRLDIRFEAPMIRKPAGIHAARDRFEIYADPVRHQIAAVRQYRTYAAQLDVFGLPESTTEFVELFVPRRYLEIGGFLLPGDYDIYGPSGERIAEGRFFDYQLNPKIDQSLFTAPDDPGLKFDTSSSYQRSNRDAR